MTIHKLLELLAKWTKEHIAGVHQFKVPPAVGDGESGEYAYTLANPGVYTMFLPLASEDGKEIAPAILIQLLNGESDGIKMNGTAQIKMVFNVWNPGIHDDGEEDGFTRNSEGWRDLLTLMDTAKTKLMQAKILNGLYLKDDPIKFTFSKNEGEIINKYPFFSGELNFSLGYYEAVPNPFPEYI